MQRWYSSNTGLMNASCAACRLPRRPLFLCHRRPEQRHLRHNPRHLFFLCLNHRLVLLFCATGAGDALSLRRVRPGSFRHHVYRAIELLTCCFFPKSPAVYDEGGFDGGARTALLNI